MCVLGLAIDGGQGNNQDVIHIIKQKGKVIALQNEILGTLIKYHAYVVIALKGIPDHCTS